LAYSHAKTTGQITRDHAVEIVNGEWTGLDFPVYSLVGGKWTSFRAFSEQATDKALAYLRLERKKNTTDLPIGGGRGFAHDETERKRQIEAIAAWTGIDKERLEVLYLRYGSRFQAVADFIKRADDGPLKSIPGYSRREILFLVMNEKVRHLDDLILRRTMLAMLGQLSRAGLIELTDVTGDALGWTGEEKKSEFTRTLSILADRHGVRL
jgi:glycerol-3-phosphate dehydrogenase